MSCSDRGSEKLLAHLKDEEESMAKSISHHARRQLGVLREFQGFVLRGNLVDLAVAVVIGAAFSKIITSLVSVFITPIFGLIFGSKAPFDSLTFTIHGQVFAYGIFITDLITFFLTAAILFFFVVKPSSALFRRLGTAVVKAPCPACRTEIPVAATRCAACTSDLGVDWSNA